MAKIEDFTKEDGLTDWDKYQEAKCNDGEICRECGSVILFPQGHRSTCHACQKIDKPEELIHEHLIRCPSCSLTSSGAEAMGESEGSIHGGNQKIICSRCDKPYIFQVVVNHTFISPTLVPNKDCKI